MTNLHFAVSLGFGAIGLAAVYCGHRMWNAELDMREKRRQVQSRINAEDEKRRLAVEDLEKRLDESLMQYTCNGSFTTLVEARRTVEQVYYQWLAGQANLFYVVWEDIVQISGSHNGEFKYTLPESIRKFKRKNRK